MFTNPTALFALGLLALPVLIHMLARMSGPRVVFASIRFLPRSVAPRFRLMKLHRWPLLVMRLVACGLLVLAISGPLLVTGDGGGRSALILLDSSLSMNSEAVKEGLVQKAREAVAALSEDDRVAVACFDRYARLLCDFTTDRSLIEQAITSYTPGYTAADFSEAFTWANERLKSQPFRRQLILISDLQATNVASPGRLELTDCDLRVIRIERPEQINASLDSVAVRSFGGRVYVTSALMLSESNRTDIKTVSLSPDELALSSETTTSNSSASLSVRSMDEGVIAGRLRAGVADSFDADDDRFFVARLPAEATVLIVQPLAATVSHALYIRKALQASLYQVPDVDPARISDRLPGALDSLRPYRAVVCPARAIDKANLSAALDYAREGGLMILTLGIEDGSLPAQLLDKASIKPLDQPQSTGLLPPVGAGDARDDEPDLLVSYGSARFRAAHSVSVSEGDVVLRYSNGEAAATRVSIGKGSLLLLGFGLSEKDTSLVRSPVFPQFIEWLVEEAGRGASVAQFIAGESRAASLLGGARKLTRIYSSDGAARNEETALDLRTLDEPGVYRVERETGDTVFAINTPASESLLAQVTEQDFVDRVTSRSGGERSDGQAFGLWWILAVAALVLSLVELVYCSSDLQAKES